MVGDIVERGETVVIPRPYEIPLVEIYHDLVKLFGFLFLVL
jgi:hypothetical protein